MISITKEEIEQKIKELKEALGIDF